MNLNLDVLEKIMKGVKYEIVEDENMMDYGCVNIRFERNLEEEEIEKLSEEWIGGVSIDGSKDIVCCWGGGNVLCDNELGINKKEDEESCLDFSIDEDGYCGFKSFRSYWKCVKGKIIGLDEYECGIVIY